MNRNKLRIKRIVQGAIKDAFSQPTGSRLDQQALAAFDDLFRYADDLIDIYRDGVTPRAADESSDPLGQAMNQIGAAIRFYGQTDDRHDIFENLLGIFMPFKDYMGQYLSDPSRYQEVMEKSVKRALSTLKDDIQTEKDAFLEYLKWEAEGEARANGGKSYLFRGKSLSFKAVKSQMTQEIVDAFNDYEDQTLEYVAYDEDGAPLKKPKKAKIADELGGLMDSVSVDPSTGEVELVMSNVLPAEHIGGAPFPLPEDEEYEGFPVVEWRDPSVIQRWIDENLDGLVIVKNVKPEGSGTNLIQGVWNGDIPMGMNVSSGKRSVSSKALKNILAARTLKALNQRIRQATFKAVKNRYR